LYHLQNLEWIELRDVTSGLPHYENRSRRNGNCPELIEHII